MATTVTAFVDATVTTDKKKYSVGEPMVISGQGFTAGQSVIVSVLRPDKVTEYVPGVAADANGAFSATYTPSLGVPGHYRITATDGTFSATTASTEADALGFDLNQCAQNDSAQGQSLGLGNCNWIPGALGSNNSLLYEGIATEQHLIITGISGTTHTLVVGIQTTKGGNHSYDFLVSDAKASGTVPDSTLNSEKASALAQITLNLNLCGDTLGTQSKNICNALRTGATPSNTVDISVPDDPFISKDGKTQDKIDAYEALFGNRTIRLYTDAAVSNVGISLIHMDGKSSGSQVPNLGDTGDTYIWYTITWTGSAQNAMLLGGADIALGGDGTGRSWGAGKGATGIPGNPYHFYLISFDGTGGSQDNQMSSNAVFTPTKLTIVKRVVNSNGGTATVNNFGITTTAGSLTFDGGVADGTNTIKYTSNTLTVVPGTFTLHEDTLAGYTEGTWSCTVGTVGSTNPQTGSVTLTQGQQTVCTITNSDQPASLRLIKALNYTHGGTASATAWTLTASGPTPISGAGGVGPNSVNAGTYNLSESAAPTGYTNGAQYSCVKNGGGAVLGNSISLVGGDTAVCTITNTDNPANLQLVKALNFTHGGTATVGNWTLTASGPTPLSGAGGVASTPVNAGTYNLSESAAPTGYTNGAQYSCVKNGGGAVLGNSIALAVGDSAVCTITNTDNPASLQLVKALNFTHGGTATVGNWTLTASGPTPLSGAGGVASTPVNAGTYNLSESAAPTGYTNGSQYSCVKNGGGAVLGNSIALAVGDSAVCTITNTDNPISLRLIKALNFTHGGTATVGNWTLTATGPTPISGAGGVGPSSVNAGTYNLSESAAPTGYTNGAQYSCVKNGGGAVLGNSIALTVGDTAVCTITNTDNPISLQLVKALNFTHGGTATVGNWTLTASGPTPISGAGGVGPSSVNAGTYNLSESAAPTGYTNGAQYSCVKNGGGAVLGNSIALVVGDTAVCTITNTDNPANLQLVKALNFTHGGTATVGNWTLTASGPTPLSGAGGVASTPVNAGTYNLSESAAPAGYTNGAQYSCVKNGGGAVLGNSIALAVGDSAVCTITNTDNPISLRLIKALNYSFGGTASATAWTLTASGPTPISGAGGVGPSSVNAGTYNLSESAAPTGYANGSQYSCVKNGGGAVLGNSIALVVGDTAVCTITNTDLPAHLTVTKILVPANDTGLFNLRIDGVNQATNVGNNGTTGSVAVAAGTHTASETAGTNTSLADYVSVIGGDCAANGQVTVAVGQSKACTITNTRRATVQLLKTLSGQVPTGAASFTFDIRTGASAAADGTVVTGGTGTANAANGGNVTFAAKLDPAGTYQFCETNVPVGWVTSISSLPGAFQPPNGGVNSTYCVAFGAGTSFPLSAGGTLTFTIDNAPPPGGGTRTIGYWKNWSSCDGKGKQAPSLDINLPQTVGDLTLAGGTPAGTSPAAGCNDAIDILNKSTITGQKMASDPAYNMAAQLLGAMLNKTAGAGTCTQSTNAIASGQALLDQINFNGKGSYAGTMTATQISVANTLASILDAYNQDNSVCSALPNPPVMAFTTANSTTKSSATGGTFQVTATATPGPTPTYSIISGAPAGVTINSTTGVLTVAVGTAPGVYPLKIAATSWGVIYQNFTLTVTP